MECLRKGKKTIFDEIANIDVIEQEGVLSSDLSIQRIVRRGELEEIIEGRNSLETKS